MQPEGSDRNISPSMRPAGAFGKGNINPLWEIFEEMRKEMNETKKVIADEIQEALEEKRMIESQLSNLCLNPKNVGRWRKIQSRLALVTLQNRAEIRQKLHGMNLFSKKDDDEARFRKISQVKIEESKKRERRRCTLYHDMRFHQLWSYFLMMLLCYTIVMVPLSLALVDYKENPGLYYFDFVVNGFFLADILFSMRTALDEERDSLFEIFIAYAKSWLVFDIIAVIPFDLIIGDSVAGITLITKIPRFMRIFRIFKLMKLGGSMKKNKIFKRISEFLNINAAVTKLLQFFVTMVIIIHVTGCLWIFLAKNDDYGPGTWVYELGYTSLDGLHLYLLSIYWAISTISTVGYGDIHPFSVTEKLFTLIWMVIGVAFYSYTVSTLSTIMLDSSSDTAKLQVKFSFLNSIAKEAKIKRELLEQLMESLEDAVEIEKINKINKADFLSDVPANLRFKVTESIYDGVANKVLIFKDRDPDLVSNLIPKMTPMKVKKSEYLYKKGQFSSAIYLLFSGRVVEMDNGINFREYSVGSYFGEIEIFKNSPRKYSMKTLEDCQLMVIERSDLLNTLKFYPELKIDMISCAIIKEMKAAQTLHKIEDLRSLIRVDEFWITEDIEFNKSVGEKIEGLYYFNKKKYETYLKQKQVNKGWFAKKGGALKALEEKGIDSFLRELKQEDERKEKDLRVAKAEQANPGQKGPKSIKQMTRSGLAGPYTEISILPPISKDLRLSGVGGQIMRPESLQDGGLEVPYDRKSLASVESFKFNGQVATQGMSPQQLDEMNKKMVQSLNSKLLFVKQNFTSTHAESRRICDKLGDIEAILNRLLGGRDAIVQDHDDSQSNNPDEPCESKGKTFSMDLSGDLKAVSGLSDAQLEQGIGELLDSFEDKEASDKTVKNKKIQANNPYLQSKHLSIKPIVTPTDSHKLKKQNATSVDDDLRSLDDQSSIFKESQFTRKEKDDDLMIARPLNPIIASSSLGEYHKKHGGLAIKPGKTSSILKGRNDTGVSQKIKYLSAKYQVDEKVDEGGGSSQMTPKHRHEKLDHTQPGLNSLMEEINRQLQENVFSAGGLGNRTPPRLSTRDRKEGSPQHRPPIKDERDKRATLPGQRTAEQKRG